MTVDRKAGDLCAEVHQEHTLCGLATDAYITGDEEVEITVAVAGDTVTCPNCRAFMVRFRQAFNGYRVR